MLTNTTVILARTPSVTAKQAALPTVSPAKIAYDDGRATDPSVEGEARLPVLALSCTMEDVGLLPFG